MTIRSATNVDKSLTENNLRERLEGVLSKMKKPSQDGDDTWSVQPRVPMDPQEKEQFRQLYNQHKVKPKSFD